MRRLFLVLLILVVLVVVALISVQLVLISDMPRRIVVARLQERLGLDVQIDDLSATWSGHAEARGVRVALPLEDTPFLEAPVLRLKHTALLRIVFTRSVDVDSVALDQPLLRVVQQPGGDWNLQQVQEVLTANLARKGPPRERGGPLPIPELDLRNARLQVDRLDHDVVELTGVSVTGRRRPPLAYALDLDIPRVGHAEARFSRAAPFTHEVSFDFAPERELIGEFVGEPTDARLVGTWHGRMSDRALRGTLRLQDASIAAVRVAGSAQLSGQADSRTLVFEPGDLAVAFGAAMTEPVSLAGGRVLVSEAGVQLQDIRVAGFDGGALLSGQLDLETWTGEFSGSWEDLALPAAFRHAGEIEVRLTRRGPTRRLVRASISTRGQSDFGNWDGVIELSAAGETYTDLAGTLRARDMRYEMRGDRYSFANLHASFATDERSLRLTRFELGDPDADMQIAGQGVFDWVDRRWAAAFTGRGVRLPAPLPSITRLRFDAAGDAEHVELRDAEIQTLGLELEASGGYVFAEPEPLAATLRLRQLPLRVGDEARPLVQARNLVGELDARGTLQPLAVSAEGRLLAEGLTVHGDQLGDVALQVQAEVDPSAAAVRAEAIEWLGGQWAVQAKYRMAEGLARLYVDATDVDLTLADRLTDGALGVAVGRADVSLEAEGVNRGPATMGVTGTFALRDLERGPLLAERVDGRIELTEGRARVTDVVATHGEGRVTGEARVDLDRPSRLRFDLTLHEWPMRLLEAGRLDTWISGRVHGDVDAAQQRGEAEAELAVQLASAEMGIGQVNLEADLAGSMLHLRSLAGRTLRGRLDGDGEVNLLEPWQTARLNVKWTDLQPSELEPWMPVLRRMTGTLSGTLTVQPIGDARALGPVRAEMRLMTTDATFRDLPIGNGRAVAYLDRDRVVLQDMMVEAMGGHVGAWGRVSEQDGERFVFASGWLTNLDLAMISETFRPDDEPLIGRFDANVSLSAPLADWQNAFGSGSMTLRESDIGAIPLIAQLYDVLNIALIGREPDGRGQGQFRFEEGAILIERFFYQNRGATIRLAGRVEDMWQGLDSPFRGVASLSLAPLPDVEFLEVLNEAFTALQADATNVRLSGRINDPDQPQVVPFRGLWDSVRRMMGLKRSEE